MSVIEFKESLSNFSVEFTKNHIEIKLKSNTSLERTAILSLKDIEGLFFASNPNHKLFYIDIFAKSYNLSLEYYSEENYKNDLSKVRDNIKF